MENKKTVEETRLIAEKIKHDNKLSALLHKEFSHSQEDELDIENTKYSNNFIAEHYINFNNNSEEKNCSNLKENKADIENTDYNNNAERYNNLNNDIKETESDKKKFKRESELSAMLWSQLSHNSKEGESDINNLKKQDTDIEEIEISEEENHQSILERKRQNIKTTCCTIQ